MQRSTYILAILLFLFASTPSAIEATEAHVERLKEVWTLASDNFVDPGMNGVDWQSSLAEFSQAAEKATTDSEFSSIVNKMLSELKTSHTVYYTSEDTKYYQLAGIFWPFLGEKLGPFMINNEPNYVGIGLFSRVHEERVFIEGVLEGFPAELAGLNVGDEIISVDGNSFRPISSFVGKDAEQVRLSIRRSADSEPIDITVVPTLIDPRTMFLDAMKNSVEIIEQNEMKVGYIRIWCYAGSVYPDQLENELGTRLKSADAVVLDLRNGYGGFGPAALRAFFMPQIEYEWRSRRGSPTLSYEAWTKPVCLLVDETTSSGKEMQTYYFKKFARGPVVGARTAGKVVAGKPFVLSDGSLLYLAVSEGTIDGVNLEGNGVQPDLVVPFDLEYANGSDPQKERAIRACLEEIENEA